MLGLAVAILAFVLYGWPLWHVLTYQEQHRLFLYSWGYIADELHQTSWADVLTTFVIQFFYYRMLGAAVMALIAGMTYSCLCGGLTRLTGRSMLSALLAAPLPLWLVAWCATIEHDPKRLVVTWVFSMLFWIVAVVVNRWWHPRRKPVGGRGWLTGSILAIAMLAGCVWLAMNKYYVQMEREAVTVEYAYVSGDYAGCVRLADKYIEEGSRLHPVHYFRILALARLGQLPERVLDHRPVFGAESMFVVWDGFVLKREYGFHFYELIGCINTAQRWQFEAMTNYGETGPTLARFAAYNIINGRDRMAAKNIRKLRQSLFYRGTADSLAKRIGTREVPGLRNLYANLPDSVGNYAFYDPMEELGYINTYAPGDSINQNLFLVGSLLDNDVERFMSGLNTFGMHDAAKMPSLYRQGLAMWMAEDHAGWWKQAGFTYPRQECERYMDFTRAYASRNKFKLKGNFADTYWYYFTNLSPKRPGSQQATRRQANIPHS